MNKYIFVKPFKNNDGTFRIVDGNGKDLTDMFPSVRQLMMELAFDNDQCLKIDTETGRCYRKGIELFDSTSKREQRMLQIEAGADAGPWRGERCIYMDKGAAGALTRKEWERKIPGRGAIWTAYVSEY